MKNQHAIIIEQQVLLLICITSNYTPNYTLHTSYSVMHKRQNKAIFPAQTDDADIKTQIWWIVRLQKLS